jgi:hypothetical protein
MKWTNLALGLTALLTSTFGGCSSAPEGLAPAAPANTTVKMDFFAKPLPEIALPNDIATRYDASSPTKRRINASMVTPTAFETRVRELLDKMDGWGVLQPIAIPFTGPIDVTSIIERHSDADYATEDDAIYVINIDEASPRYGELQHLDFGNGNYPVVLERRDLYWKNDPRGDSMSLLWEEANEDLNGNGVLDPGEDVNGNGVLDPGEDVNGNGVLDPPEDTDADGILDRANYLPGHAPAADDLAGRTDALMTFYEKSSNTLVGRPLVPMEDRTRYAVVVTRRVLDLAGDPVGSPYAFINHTAQTEELKPLLAVLPPGLAVSDIAFTYSFTTQTIRADWQAVRDGLYGYGAQAALSTSYPAELANVAAMRDAGKFPGMKNPHLLYGEDFRPALEKLLADLLGGEEGLQTDLTLEGTGYIDFISSGSFVSPQLMPRFDAEGTPLPLHDQVWPQDLASAPAPAYPEDVYYTLAVPRKEVSVRGEGKPAPVVILGHGYTSNRFEAIQFSGYLARHGFAVIGIDGPSHGIEISDIEKAVAVGILGEFGLSAAGEALLTDRAFDQNFDNKKDSGADFWTSYLFHTRDMVRQYALDYMQLVRILKSFDGERRWAHDLDGDGQPELAGDFDGDGVVDVGAGSQLYAFGGSLGGIMSMVLGAVEPGITAIAPVSGGGGYGDMGPRSTQGGVYQAFILRAMGPLFVGTTNPDSGNMLLETIVVDMNDDPEITIGIVPGVKPWDTMVVENLRNGVRRCAFVAADGTVRASMESDVNDPVRLRFYRGPQILPSEDCQLREGAENYANIETFMEDVVFRGELYPKGSQLVTLMEGLGMRRGHPDFRKLAGFGQLVLEPSDPASLARHLLKDPLEYPGSGEKTGAHSLIITTMGDTAVPVSGGAAVGRAAGIIDYLNVDPRYGKPLNQVLIDTYTLEGVHNLNRYTNSLGEGVHLDLESFSGGDDMYGTEVPRFDQPPRIGFDKTDALGGKSAAIFPYNVPGGQHGFDLPGGMTDRARKQCLEACTEPEPDPCGCSTLETFDIGLFMMNMMGRYFRSEGKELSSDLCMSRNDCPELVPPPPGRDTATLP